MKLGEFVKNYRVEKGMSMRSFASASGLSIGYISMLENNRNPKTNEPITPSIETYKAVSKATGVNLGELVSIVSDNIDISCIQPNIDNFFSKKEQTNVPQDIGPNKQMLDFEKATKALSEAINKLNAGECTAKLGAEDIKVICPIDGTEQIIHQTYAIIGGKRFAQENNGCDNYSGHKECDLCRWRVTLQVTNG